MSTSVALAGIDDELSQDSATNTTSERPAASNSSNEKADNQDDTRSKSTASTNDDDDTDSNASSEYEVEKIVAKRRRRRGGFEYYIKWVGYDDSANEWIPAVDLNCPDRLAEFEREEERKQKQTAKPKQQRRSSQKRRTSNLPNSKRTKVIEDEDEDDESSRASSVSSSQVPNKTPPVVANPKRIPMPASYGVDHGFKVQAVLGINHEQDNQLHYLVHYVPPTTIEDDMELLPATVARVHCEEEIIQFFESRIAWNNHPKDRGENIMHRIR